MMLESPVQKQYLQEASSTFLKIQLKPKSLVLQCFSH